MLDDKLTFNRSLLWILISTLLVSGSSFMGWQYFLHLRELRYKDHQFNIVAIIQDSNHRESLKTAFLAELIELSFDQPKNLYQFDLREAEKKLLSCPIIKKASIQKIFPTTLCIDYRIRYPAAYLADFSNTVLDRDGTIFPFRPYFSPKRLPTIFLGIEERNLQWGEGLREKDKIRWAFDILEQFSDYPQLSVKQIDLSLVNVSRYGQRQIVVILEDPLTDWGDGKKEVFLRLNPKHYRQNISNFRILYEVSHYQQVAQGEGKNFIVDFRIPHLAFVKYVE